MLISRNSSKFRQICEFMTSVRIEFSHGAFVCLLKPRRGVKKVEHGAEPIDFTSSPTTHMHVKWTDPLFTASLPGPALCLDTVPSSAMHVGVFQSQTLGPCSTSCVLSHP